MPWYEYIAWACLIAIVAGGVLIPLAAAVWHSHYSLYAYERARASGASHETAQAHAKKHEGPGNGKAA